MKKEPEKKKPSFKERCRDAFNGVSKREWMHVVKETLQDLRRPGEIALLAGCTFLPGGWIGYGVYRIAKHRRQKAANDNPPPDAAPKKEPPQGKRKKPPAAGPKGPSL